MNKYLYSVYSFVLTEYFQSDSHLIAPVRMYLFGFLGEMSIAGPGAGISIGNMSTHISMRPFEEIKKNLL